ncbi:recombinase family protein [Cystobacter fuscus]
MNDKVRVTHLERRAVVYLRQSTLRQVHEHRESTARQYALRQRALELGWPPERIDIIDEDMGQSGTNADKRAGFQRMAEEVAHGRVGVILSLEVSRRRAPRRTGTGCWTCAGWPTCCWPMSRPSTPRAITTTVCCWASRAP